MVLDLIVAVRYFILTNSNTISNTNSRLAALPAVQAVWDPGVREPPCRHEFLHEAVHGAVGVS